jgi:type II secretion system protein G
MSDVTQPPAVTDADKGESASAPPPRFGRPLVGVALVLGLLVLAMVVPNVLNGAHRGRQKRTMGDLRTLATAMESYSIDNYRYPVLPASAEPVGPALAPLLEPTYVRKLPLVDGWGGEFRFHGNAKEYTITSFGKDGLPDSESPHFVSPTGGTTDFRSDIIFSTGSFVQFPDGTMT